jgi:hypothetical protein
MVPSEARGEEHAAAVIDHHCALPAHLPECIDVTELDALPGSEAGQAPRTRLTCSGGARARSRSTPAHHTRNPPRAEPSQLSGQTRPRRGSFSSMTATNLSCQPPPKHRTAGRLPQATPAHTPRSQAISAWGRYLHHSRIPRGFHLQAGFRGFHLQAVSAVSICKRFPRFPSASLTASSTTLCTPRFPPTA